MLSVRVQDVEMIVDKIKEFCGNDWKRVGVRMKGSLMSDISLLNSTNDMILSHSGKQLRPMLSLLVAKACSGDGVLPEDSIRVAAAAELLHNATLLHDDVADESDVRRGNPTLNSLMGPSVSVLVGDYWLVAAMNEIQAAEHFGPRLISIFSRTLTHLAEGEMLQLQKARSGDTVEEDYLRIIFSKTASLFEAAALAAAISVNAGAEAEEAVRKYAVSLGLAFQIRDDIFDYSDDRGIGKPVGVDIMEQKITMPLLGAFRNASPEEEREVRTWISSIREHPEYGPEIVDFVRSRDGISYAEKRLGDYIGAATDAIAGFQKTRSGRYLEEMAHYVAERRI